MFLPVVCKSMNLGIRYIDDYKNFIQNPTGIEKLVNAQSFRLDLTDEIQTEKVTIRFCYSTFVKI